MYDSESEWLSKDITRSLVEEKEDRGRIIGRIMRVDFEINKNKIYVLNIVKKGNFLLSDWQIRLLWCFCMLLVNTNDVN